MVPSLYLASWSCHWCRGREATEVEKVFGQITGLPKLGLVVHYSVRVPAKNCASGTRAKWNRVRGRERKWRKKGYWRTDREFYVLVRLWSKLFFYLLVQQPSDNDLALNCNHDSSCWCGHSNHIPVDFGNCRYNSSLCSSLQSITRNLWFVTSFCLSSCCYE